MRFLLLTLLFLAAAYGSVSDGLLSDGSASVIGTNEVSTVVFGAYQASGNVMVIYNFGGQADELKATFPGSALFGVVGTVSTNCPASSPGYIDIYSPSTFSILDSYTVSSASNAPFNFALTGYAAQLNQLFILRLRTGSTDCSVSVTNTALGLIVGTPPSAYVGDASLNNAALTAYSPLTNHVIGNYTGSANSGQYIIYSTAIGIVNPGLAIVTFSFQLEFIDCTGGDELIFTFTVNYGSQSSQFVLSQDDAGFYSVSYAFNAANQNQVSAQLSTRFTERSHGCEFEMDDITLAVDQIFN